jgi:hypothetical protein
MKKRTKITLRTKIYLTIGGLLALTEVFYAQFPPSHPAPFSGQVPFPTGVAAAPDLLLVSEYCSENIDQLDCNGTASLFATLPGFGSCREKYIAIAPSQSAAAGFTPRDVFATEGANVFKIDSSTRTVTLFTTIGGCSATDHNGITFDHFGTFGNDMIVTCQEGDVFKIDNLPGGPHVTLIASLPLLATGGLIEGPAVVPPGFGPHGGEIWVADEGGSAVHAIKNDGTFTLNILSHESAEAVNVIPQNPCTFTPVNPTPTPCAAGQGDGALFLAEQQMLQLVWKYPVTDFTLPPPGLGGNVLVTSEGGGDTSLVTVSGGNYVQSSFGPRVGGANEGSSFVDCDVPLPTPTPVSQITETGTTCAQFSGGTAQTLSSVQYTVKNGAILQENPGVFFYWVKVTAPAGNNTFVVNQSITTGNFNTLFAIASGSNVYNSSCTNVHGTFTQSSINNTSGTVTVTFNAATAGTYYIGVKFQTTSVTGKTAPTPSTVGYTYSTTGVPGSTSSLNLVKR